MECNHRYHRILNLKYKNHTEVIRVIIGDNSLTNQIIQIFIPFL